MMDGEQRLDISCDLDAGGDENHEVVTDPLEVGDEMRREHDAHAVLSRDGHEGLQKLAASERVEACYRFIEDKQLWPLGYP